MVSGGGRTVTVTLVGDADSLRRMLRASGQEVDEFERRVGTGSRGVSSSFGGIISGAALAGAAVAATGLVVRGLVDDAQAAARSQAILEGALKASGGAAGVSLGQLEGYASGLMKATGISDEAIKESEAVLLTFRNVSAPIFQETLELAADMSTVFGQDLSSSAVQLGKALQDPVEGVSALRRIGVQLSDEQEKQIALFVRSGDVMKAQRIILDEVSSQVGGVARATGEGAGKITRLTESLGELREEAGGAALKGLQPLIDKALEWAQSDDAVEAARDFGAALAGIADKGGDVLVALQAVRDSSPYRAVVELVDGEGNLLSIAALAALGGRLGVIGAAGLAGNAVGKKLVGDAVPRDWWESIQTMLPPLQGVPFGGETAQERLARQQAHSASEGSLGPADFTAPTGPSMGVDPTRPVGPGNPSVLTKSGASSGGGGGGGSASGRKATSLSAESLAFLDSVVGGLPGEFAPSALDESFVEEFERREAAFDSAAQSLKRGMAETELSMLGLDARGLELSDEYLAQQDRMTALKEASKAIDLVRDMRLEPLRPAMEAIAESVDRIRESGELLDRQSKDWFKSEFDRLIGAGTRFSPQAFNVYARGAGLNIPDGPTTYYSSDFPGQSSSTPFPGQSGVDVVMP